MIRRSILLMSVLALVATVCTSEGGEVASPSASPSPCVTSPTVTASPPSDIITLPGATVLFAELTNVPLFGTNAPPYAGPPTPDSLNGVQMAPVVEATLEDPAIRAALLENGFVVVPSGNLLFHFAYQGNVYEGWPVFVTTDVAYHTWHLVFDKVLRTLEQEVLLPKLETLVGGLARAAQYQTTELGGTPLADAAYRVEQLYGVAAAELGIPGAIFGSLGEQEKALIDAHNATEASPLVGGKIDYSLFTPRGHYTRNADLERFFVAMSVLGQLAFCLPGTMDCPGLEPARMSILASRLLAQDPELVELWRQIYEPTAFLVGLADGGGHDGERRVLRSGARDGVGRGV